MFTSPTEAIDEAGAIVPDGIPFDLYRTRGSNKLVRWTTRCASKYNTKTLPVCGSTVVGIARSINPLPSKSPTTKEAQSLMPTSLLIPQLLR